jgi:competence protein ComEC
MWIGGGIVSSFVSQQHISKNIAIMDSYSWLYNSHKWEVKWLYKRSEYHDEYVIYLRQIDDRVIDQKVQHILRLPKNFMLHPGQVISYSWKMYPLENFDGFAYKKYMLSKWIYFSASSSSIDTISEHKYGWKFIFYDSRQRLLSRIEKIFPQQEAIFLWGILFWARENIPKDLKEDFNNSGLTHFIAVSGFNITLCVIFMTFLFGFLPSTLRVIVVSLSIIAFSVFVWLWAPVVRAAIMWVLWYIFLQSWNTSKAITLLVFTAVCMTILNPLALSYDVSLHLSFLAVVGIMYTQSLFQKIFYWVPNIFAIREAFVLTLAALSFSLPIMIFQFWQVSLLTPFANIAVTWTIPLAMIGGTVTLIADSISPFLWEMVWFITWILLKYDMMMVSFFWNIDWALMRVEFWAYSIYLQSLYFIVLTYVLALYHQRKKTSEKQSETTISKLKQSK